MTGALPSNRHASQQGPAPDVLRNASIASHEPTIRDGDALLELEMMPRPVAQIDSGVIGCEYATTSAALGTRVSIIDRRERAPSSRSLARPLKGTLGKRSLDRQNRVPRP